MKILLLALLAATANTAFLIATHALLRRYGLRAINLMHPGTILAACCLGALQAPFVGGMPDLNAAVAIVISAAVAASVLSDIVSGFIFDAVTLTGLAAGLVLSGAVGNMLQALAGAAAGGAAVGALHLITRGRGMGLGDAKLAACIGCAAGPVGALESIGAAFVIGGAVAAAMLLSRSGGPKTSVPFAPFLAAGAAVTMSVGRT